MAIDPSDRERLTGHDVAAELLEDWRILFGALAARFRTGDFAAGVALLQQIGEAAEAMDHHPDLDLRYDHLDVRLSSHDVRGVTRRDVRLARTISELAGSAGAEADTRSLQTVEWALDTWDAAEVRPFWAAVLGLSEDASEPDEIVDAGGRWATVWFQETDRHETPRQRWHVDVRVPPEVAEARIRAALDAGGTLVSDDRAPAYWVLADAQGNRACFTTWLGRTPAPDGPESGGESGGESG